MHVLYQVLVGEMLGAENIPGIFSVLP